MSPVISQVKGFIDEILESYRKALRKQRHTAHRIYDRIDKELKVKIGESTVERSAIFGETTWCRYRPGASRR
ncbi:MAG: hypothetical protein ACK5QT_00510 [Oligoflexia bacterium]